MSASKTLLQVFIIIPQSEGNYAFIPGIYSRKQKEGEIAMKILVRVLVKSFAKSPSLHPSHFWLMFSRLDFADQFRSNHAEV